MSEWVDRLGHSFLRTSLAITQVIQKLKIHLKDFPFALFHDWILLHGRRSSHNFMLHANHLRAGFGPTCFIRDTASLKIARPTTEMSEWVERLEGTLVSKNLQILHDSSRSPRSTWKIFRSHYYTRLNFLLFPYTTSPRTAVAHARWRRKLMRQTSAVAC